MRSKRVLLLVLGLMAFALYTFDQLRTRDIAASEQMTWECTDHSRIHPGRVVILRFLRAPEYFGFRDDPTGSFCRFVSDRGHPIVTVAARLHGSKRDGFSSWTDETMDGAPIPLGFSGGDGTEGQPTHVFPFQQDFNAARHHGFNWLR